MRIEHGWLHFEKVDEALNIELEEIKFNSNNNPYAVAHTIKTDEENMRIKFNIGKKHVGLKQGRYTIICTTVTPTGFAYMDFKPLQDSSWDVHDQQDSLRSFDADEMEEDSLTKQDLLDDIKLVQYCRDNLNYCDSVMTVGFETCFTRLKQELGKKVVEEEL